METSCRSGSFFSEVSPSGVFLPARCSTGLGVRREGDSPEVSRQIALFDKLDAIDLLSLHSTHLRHNARRDLGSAFVSKYEHHAYREFPRYLDCCAMPIQACGIEIGRA